MQQRTIHVTTTCPIIAAKIEDDLTRLLKGYERVIDDGHLKRGALLALASLTVSPWQVVESSVGQPNAQAV